MQSARKSLTISSLKQAGQDKMDSAKRKMLMAMGTKDSLEFTARNQSTEFAAARELYKEDQKQVDELVKRGKAHQDKIAVSRAAQQEWGSVFSSYGSYEEKQEPTEGQKLDPSASISLFGEIQQTIAESHQSMLERSVDSMVASLRTLKDQDGLFEEARRAKARYYQAGMELDEAWAKVKQLDAQLKDTKKPLAPAEKQQLEEKLIGLQTEVASSRLKHDELEKASAEALLHADTTLQNEIAFRTCRYFEMQLRYHAAAVKLLEKHQSVFLEVAASLPVREAKPKPAKPKKEKPENPASLSTQPSASILDVPVSEANLEHLTKDRPAQQKKRAPTRRRKVVHESDSDEPDSSDSDQEPTTPVPAHLSSHIQPHLIH
eukprot:TRINITY_DN3405_c0_g1_i1.p1 TRINITY_DN3405_c0_g1~~TRINITY_DN3405_c0_g1_i1.p1  ORF type:complete len:376 (-),score=98.38 TRINITY_DN3405_c0_g1_i1:236-1363(-)